MQPFVVNQDQIAVERALHIDLDAVDADLDGLLDRGTAVAGVEVAGAAVADDLDLPECPIRCIHGRGVPHSLR